MIKLLYILLAIIIFLVFCIIVANVYHTKFQFSISKIKQAEKEIDTLLQRKLELMKEVAPQIKKELNLTKFLDSLNTIEEKNFNNIELNDFLALKYRKILQKMEQNEKLYKSEDIVSLVNMLADHEVDLYATIKFYNDTIVSYNQLIISFPSNIFALFFRYRKKEFYKQERHESFEILKEEKKDK